LIQAKFSETGDLKFLSRPEDKKQEFVLFKNIIEDCYLKHKPTRSSSGEVLIVLVRDRFGKLNALKHINPSVGYEAVADCSHSAIKSKLK